MIPKGMEFKTLIDYYTFVPSNPKITKIKENRILLGNIAKMTVYNLSYIVRLSGIFNEAYKQEPLKY